MNRSQPDRPDPLRRAWSAPTDEPGIVVVDPGSLPTTQQMAAAVADRLSAYWTPIAVDPAGFAAHFPLVGRSARRRPLAPEVAAKVHRAETATEIASVALASAGMRDAAAGLRWRREIALDMRAAVSLKAGETVIGQAGGCLASFKRAKVLYGRTVLDYTILRKDFGPRVLEDESAMAPEFADTPSVRATVSEQSARLSAELHLADIVVVGSQLAAGSFEGVVEPSRLQVIPHGVDVAEFFPAPVSPGRTRLRVLFAGTVTQRKGIAYLLDAMRSLDPAKFELTIVGPAARAIADLRRYEGLHRHTVARAHDMPSVYRRADVLVLPSLLEGSAVVTLEAMASGIPVVVTPNTGADAVRDGVDGFVVPLRSADAIAARLEQLQSDHGLRRRMGAAARARSLEFTWESFRRKFRSALEIDAGVMPAHDIEELSA